MENTICDLKDELDQQTRENHFLKVDLEMAKNDMEKEKEKSEEKILWFEMETKLLQKNMDKAAIDISVLTKDLKDSKENFKKMHKKIKHLTTENSELQKGFDEKSLENKDLKEDCEILMLREAQTKFQMETEKSSFTTYLKNRRVSNCGNCMTVHKKVQHQKKIFDKKEKNLKEELEKRKSELAKLLHEKQQNMPKLLQLTDKLNSQKGKMIWYESLNETLKNKNESLAAEVQMLKLEKSKLSLIPPISRNQSNDECDYDCPLKGTGLKCMGT